MGAVAGEELLERLEAFFCDPEITSSIGEFFAESLPGERRASGRSSVDTTPGLDVAALPSCLRPRDNTHTP